MLTLEYEQSWTAAERLYLSDYLKSGARGKASAAATAQVHAAGGGGRQGPAARDGRRDRAGAGAGRQAGIPADGRGREGRHRAADMGDGVVQRPWAARADEPGSSTAIMTSWDFYQKPVYLVAGVLRAGSVRGGAEGPGAADDLEAWASAARAGAGDDGGVQREAGQVEGADDVLCRMGSCSSMKSRRWADKTLP